MELSSSLGGDQERECDVPRRAGDRRRQVIAPRAKGLTSRDLYTETRTLLISP